MYNQLPAYAYTNPIGITKKGMHVLGAPGNITDEEYEKAEEAVFKFTFGSVVTIGVIAFVMNEVLKKLDE